MEDLFAQHVSNIAVWPNFGVGAALVLPHIPPQHIKSCPIFFTISVWAFWKPGSREFLISSKLSSTACKVFESCKVLGEERRRWTPPPVAPPGPKHLSAGWLNVSPCPCLPAGAELLSYAVGPALVHWTGCRSHLIITEFIRKEENKGRMEGREKHIDKYSIILW